MSEDKILTNEQIDELPLIPESEEAGSLFDDVEVKNPEDAYQEYEDALIICDSLVKLFKSDEIEVMALQGLDLVIKRGEFLSIIGKSGSGKSTLLNMIGGLETPTTGRLIINGKDMSNYKEKDMVKYRNKTVGFVWQKSSRNLFQYMTVVQNVESVLYFKRMSQKKRHERAMELLRLVGMEAHADKFPSELSGGEQQRVAIALALSNEPDILLADEPTGAVDTKTSDAVFEVFKKLNKEKGITIIIVTHDLRLASLVDRVVNISDGKISTEKHKEEEETSVLDKAHRLKLTDEVLLKAGITSDRVRVEVIDEKVVITKE